MTVYKNSSRIPYWLLPAGFRTGGRSYRCQTPVESTPCMGSEGETLSSFKRNLKMFLFDKAYI